jgi:hypothetical protein
MLMEQPFTQDLGEAHIITFCQYLLLFLVEPHIAHQGLILFHGLSFDSRKAKMIDPITALAAVSSAVNLVKKAVATVQDVQSLGPVLGKYFDAKAAAIEVVEKSKSGGFAGSAMGKALELEMALEQAREFEEQVKMLFFQSNKMDVWMRITARAQQMEADAAHAARRRKDAEKKRAEEMEETLTLVIGGIIALVSAGVIAWVVIQIVTGSVK